jgi:hypothetical protein
MEGTSRRERVTRLYESGATLEEIGRAENVTREWARRLLERYEVPKRPRADRLYDAAFPARAEEVEALFLQLRDDSGVARQTGLDTATIRRFVDATIPDASVLRRRRQSHSAHYSDDEFIACLRAGSEELPSPMAHAAYAAWARDRMLDTDRPWTGPQGMMLRFGSWRNALPRGPASQSDGGTGSKIRVDGRRQRDRGSLGGNGQATNGRRVRPVACWTARVPGASATARKFVDGWDALLLAAWPIVHNRPLPGVGSQEVESDGSTKAAAQRGGGQYRKAEENPAVAASDPFERDPQELERSLGSHNSLQNALADRARDRGIEPLSAAPGW